MPLDHVLRVISPGVASSGLASESMLSFVPSYPFKENINLLSFSVSSGTAQKKNLAMTVLNETRRSLFNFVKPLGPYG